MIAPSIVVCPKYLPPRTFNKLLKSGWEWEEKEKCFHFDCITDSDEGIGFDAYIEQEKPLELSLYFCEYKIELNKNRIGNSNIQEYSDTKIQSLDVLLRVIQPYIDRASNHCVNYF